MTDALLAGDLPLPPRPDYLRHGSTVAIVADHDGPQAHRDPLRDHHHGLLLHGRRRNHAGTAGAVHAERRAAYLGHLQQTVFVSRHRHGVVLPCAVNSQHARQFPVATDDRRARCRLSAAQSVELVPDHRRRRLHRLRADCRRRRYRLDLLYALLDDVLEQPRVGCCVWGFRRRLRQHRHRGQLHRHDAHASRPRA